MAEENKGNKEKNTGMAIVAYIIFFIPLLTDAKNDPFVKYHVNQGFVMFLAWIISSFLVMVPVVGWILPFVIFVFWIMGIVNASGGKKKPVPLIGGIGESLNIF